MAEFTSETKTIPHANHEVFAVLSDLNNLELAKDLIPDEKVKEFTFDKDSCTVSVAPIGKIKFNIVERNPDSTIKFVAEQVPFGLTMCIALKNNDDTETEMQLIVDADLNPFLKPMVSKPLQQGLDKIAELLALLPYSTIVNKGENKEEIE